ncbi:efflux RND transporter periplasmic adaptor subunit [Leptospira stimsonii]|uniref:Efflux RND transporter periplasmic adaptor subunit n=1 Tax=Leptospira stimsonii TaxID=2202203 RepID=A0ABY2MU47_9LEPT|nr:efflux RND transporter periplasmic adaptor subunit [Leptospira stimsonii]TGK23392.1 efflux RND transporter periplasmic adaptor subunit [Leptospira stimsonii]TGM07904.1 efflux RND transporter periplasmic adaptor subunit [Leptospira stimsonii]
MKIINFILQRGYALFKIKYVKTLFILICIFILYRIATFPDQKGFLKGKESSFYSILNWFKSRGKTDSIDMDSILVRAIAVHPEKINPSIQTLGTIDFLDKVDIVSKTAGNITEIQVKEGGKVQKGDILLRIDTLQLELEKRKNISALQSAMSGLRLSEEKYLKAKDAIEVRMLDIEKRKTQLKETRAELAKMKATFTGKQTLYQAGGISKEEIESAQTALIASEAKYRISQKDLEMGLVGFRPEDLTSKGIAIPDDPKEKMKAFAHINTLIEKAEVEVAKSQVDSAKAALESTEELIRAATIRSPSNGVVAYINKHIGEYVNPGAVNSPDQAIMVLVNISKVYAKFNVRENDMISIHKDMLIEFTADVYPDKKFSGKVGIINPIVDPKTHTMEIKALINNDDRLLTPGMFLRGNIYTGDSRFVILVPTEALVAKENENAWLFTLNNGLALRVKVKTGKQYEDKTEVIEGIEPGSIIAIEKLTQLKDGMKIRPQLETSLE